MKTSGTALFKGQNNVMKTQLFFLSLLWFLLNWLRRHLGGRGRKVQASRGPKNRTLPQSKKYQLMPDIVLSSLIFHGPSLRQKLWPLEIQCSDWQTCVSILEARIEIKYTTSRQNENCYFNSCNANFNSFLWGQFCFLFICAYNVWVISPLFPPPPSLSPASYLSPPPPRYQAETILPLSLVLLKREYKQ
jgi:hypothetical protein